MFLDAMLVGEDGQLVRGGVDSAFVLEVLADHDTFFNTPTKFNVEECEKEKVAEMTLTDVWVNQLSFNPKFWSSLPRPDVWVGAN